MNDTSTTGQCAVEMPRYKCHKEVWALKIATINLERGGAVMSPVEKGYGLFFVDADYILKHKPEVGGYYVVYADGYKSFSPAKAFEDGYTKV